MKNIENIDVRDRLEGLKKKCDRGELRGLVAFVFDGDLHVNRRNPGWINLKAWFRIMQPWVDGEASEACEALA
jgi:hypothetical protein